MSENLAEHYALPTPQEEVDDEIPEQRSIGARGKKGYSR